MRAAGFILLLLSTLSWSAETLASDDGAELFRLNCAVCHGDDGKGGVGVPLASSDFLLSVDDHYIATTIRMGRPGRIMPAFESLGDTQIAAIIGHIRGWEPAGSESAIDTRPVAGDRQRGRALYQTHCASCHGSNGEGGDGTGVTYSRPRAYQVIPPALNNRGFLAAATDRVIRTTIERGRSGTAMVPFAKRLSRQQIDDIVAFVRSFEEQPLEEPLEVEEETTIEMESSNTLEETVENLKRAALGKNFRIIRVQHLEDGLFDEGEVNQRQTIVYFCNFSFINGALKLDPRVGLFMPCRITVVESDEGVKLYAINPKYLSRLFNNKAMDESCQQMYDIYTDIMEEATL